MIIGASGAKPSRTADLERKLVHHCSPALAGLKPANMFVYREGIDADAFRDPILDSTNAQELGICRKAHGDRAAARRPYRYSTTLSPIAAVPSTWSAGVASSAMSRVRQPSSRTRSTADSTQPASPVMSKA